MSFDFRNETSARSIPAEVRCLPEGDDDRNSQTSEDLFFSSRILAGFECGYLGWNGHDLLRTTEHVPERRMAAHYARIKEHGLTTARDGLPWRHDPVPRIEAAADAGVEVIWDLNHYDPAPNPVDHARRATTAADPERALWLCPVNEPSLYPALTGMTKAAAVEMAITMARVAKDHHPDVRILSTDPITGVGERQFEATDALVATGLVDLVGVNYYPHTARALLHKVLLKAWRRYRKPLLVAETSWHDGHPLHHRRHPGFNKAAWFRYVIEEVAFAQGRGAEVVGVCWYPIVDCPPWNWPGSHSRWSHGLIRKDLSVDEHLSSALRHSR